MTSHRTTPELVITDDERAAHLDLSAEQLEIVRHNARAGLRVLRATEGQPRQTAERMVVTAHLVFLANDLYVPHDDWKRCPTYDLMTQKSAPLRTKAFLRSALAMSRFALRRHALDPQAAEAAIDLIRAMATTEITRHYALPHAEMNERIGVLLGILEEGIPWGNEGIYGQFDLAFCEYETKHGLT